MSNLQQQYFELELEKGDIYKGTLQTDSGSDSHTMTGFAMFQKKNKFIIIGSVQNGVFQGPGMYLDMSEYCVYLGGLRDSMKDGAGILMKQKSPVQFQNYTRLFEQCNKDNYKRVIQDQIDKAQSEQEKAIIKIQKYSGIFMSAPLKEVFKKVKYSQDQIDKKKLKRTKQLETYQILYQGEFQEDKRHGWGCNIFRNGDSYKGQYERDIMEGRGIYIFNSMESNSVLYVGEVKNNVVQGLGKMTFRDDTQYFGSFSNNLMQSAKAIIKFGNGDRFKGGISQNQKSGDGEYIFSNTDTYTGQFKGDRREGQGKMSHTATQVIYEGEFKDDKKCGKCDKYHFGNSYGTYTGSVDEDEELCGSNGKFVFPLQNMIYEGEFKNSMFNGLGRITHTDTGNVYEGEFFDHHKDGPCTFTLKNGQQFRGMFQLNMEGDKGGDYGLRE